jgi:hypothetical protein
MITRDMEDFQGSYNHEEVIGIHVSMGNEDIESNGHKSRVETVEMDETMQILQKEVHIYRVENERIMRDHEEILPSLNMLQNQVNKNYGTKQAASARQVETFIFHDRRDDNEGSRQSRSIRRHHHQHHSPRNSSRREYLH